MEEHTYYCPKTLEEALSQLKASEGKARLIAGGTDLMINIGNAPEKFLQVIDVSQVAELQGIKEEEGYILIGGGVTHAEVAKCALIKKQGAVLAKACSQVGSAQIRNVATLAGNIVTALPAADGAVALTALDAECCIVSIDGKSTWKPISTLYAGVGKSTLNHGKEILTQIRFKVDPIRKSAYERMVIRKALSLPMLCVGAVLSIRNNTIEQARVIVSPVGPSPLCAEKVENFLLGKSPSEAVFKEAAAFSLENTQIRASAVRGGKEYREKVLPVFVKRALMQAAL